MGPPPFGGGNPRAIVAAPWEKSASMGPPPFGGGNFHSRKPKGPMYWLQWGHRLSAVETSAWRWVTFSGSTLQWGHRLSAVETILGTNLMLLCIGRFNGATAFRRWKRAGGGPSDDQGDAQLQWGHRLSAVETRKQDTLPALSAGASMGPPPFGGGNDSGRAYIADSSDASMGPPPFGGGN